MNKTNNATLAADLKEMMAAWSKIETAARREYPKCSEEEIFEICKGAMNHALKLG